MYQKQHTIKQAVSISGVGLHTGMDVNMTFQPAPANHGIKFQRTDIENEPVVHADVDNVVDISRGTSLAENDVRINTVEHTLAAVAGLQIDNIIIQLDGPEPPIADGSAREFVEHLEEAGLQEQDAPRDFLEVPNSVNHKDEENNVEIAALPLDDYRVTVMVDYNSPVLGSQHASLNDITRFKEEIAPCRTFCFLHELEMLYNQDLVKGGDLNNAIVVVDRQVNNNELTHLASLFNKPEVEVNHEGGILNNVDLRFKNEPARHKLLDLIGDLALVGKPIKAQILAARPGHEANVAFAKKLKQSIRESNNNHIPKYDSSTPIVMDSNQIKEMLPHRYPFQLVDKIIHLDDNSVSGVKNVTINEHYFQGHFPDNPVMPGVLQVEAMAQIGGIFVLNTVPDPGNYWTYFLAIDECKFRKMVVPGDTLVCRCELLAPIKRGIAKMRGTAYVGDKIVCEAVLTANIVKKTS